MERRRRRGGTAEAQGSSVLSKKITCFGLLV
jgi:hypothetical protein